VPVRYDIDGAVAVVGLPLDEALLNQYRHGMATLETGEFLGGSKPDESGAWR
jgi:hypothetical protein